MKNFAQPGDTITVTAPDIVKSGDLVLVGSLFGIAATDAVSGDPVEIAATGVFTLPKTSAQAWTQGAKIYWDGAACTTVTTDNTFIGHAVEAAANPSATGKVRLSI